VRVGSRKIKRVRTSTVQREEVAAAVAVAILAGVPVVSLSASNGGFFPPTWGWATMGFALAAAAVLALADTVEVGRLDVLALGALVSFSVWIGVSLLWSESQTRTMLELQRALMYVVALAALLLAVRRSTSRAALAGVTVAVALVALYGLATRLFPDLFGFDDEGPYQLSRPIGYWNALGLLAAMGVVLTLAWAAHARSRVVRPAAAAALPALVVALYFTFSRGAWVGLVLALVVLFATDPRRARAAAVLVAVLPFTAAAVALASQSDGLTSANATVDQATSDGRWLALALLVLCAAAAVAAAAVDRIGSELFRRAHLRPAAGYVAVGLGVAAAVALLVWGGGPRAVADRAYDAFVGPPVLGNDDLNARLLSASGNSRADYWSVALGTVEDAPLLGTGAGTFDLRWYLDRPGHGTVRDAHNIYLEALAELGPLGLALLVVALGTPLAALGLTRDPLAAAGGAAYAAYLAHAGLDWDWELPAVTLAAFACGASVMASARAGSRPLGPRARTAALVAMCIAGTAGLAGYLGARAIEGSAAAFDDGDFARARDSADDAVRFAPWSGHALLARGEAELALASADAARSSFRRAVEKEPNDWYAWYQLALSSDGPERERAIERAHELNPLSPELAALER
jgi:O-antigen ligase